MKGLGLSILTLMSVRAAQAIICPKPSGYTGRMVFPLGSRQVEACTPEFPGDGVRTFLAHDYIPMAGSTLTPQPSAATVEACQALCQKAADVVSGCQYFLFDGYAKSGRQCALRLKGVAPAVFGPMGASEAKVLFEIGPGRYSAYLADPSDWGSLGSSITHHATLDDALKACGLQAGCVGIKYSPAGGARPYMTFGGSLAEGVVGKVRTTGPSINPWAHYM